MIECMFLYTNLTKLLLNSLTIQEILKLCFLGYPAEKLVHTAIPKPDDSNGTPYLYFTEGMFKFKVFCFMTF